MRGKTLFALALILALVLFGTIGTHKVSGAWTGPTGPAVYVTWDDYSYVDVSPRVGVWDPGLYNYAIAYIKVYLPQSTHEPTEPGDMTWQGRVDISWDPTVLQIADPASEILRPPLWSALDPTTPGLWSQFNYWRWSINKFVTSGSYSVTYIPVSEPDGPGTASVTTGLLSPSPTTVALPATWQTAATKAPDWVSTTSYHSGTNYDLPWTPNTIWTPQATGKGIYEDHVWLAFRVLKDGTNDFSKVDITFARFLTFGGTEIPMEKVGGWYGKIGEVPEFPLGLGIVTLIAPMAAIAYIWRLRRNKGLKQ